MAKYDERSWQTKNGDKRKAYEFIVSEVESHDPKRATTVTCAITSRWHSENK